MLAEAFGRLEQRIIWRLNGMLRHYKNSRLRFILRAHEFQRSRRLQSMNQGAFNSVFYQTNKEAWTVLCSVVKHAGSGRARKCREKHEKQSSVSPYFLSALPLPQCFTTEQSTVEASLFVCYKESINLPKHSTEFSNRTLFSKRGKVASLCICSLIKHAKIRQSQSLLGLFK